VNSRSPARAPSVCYHGPQRHHGGDLRLSRTLSRVSRRCQAECTQIRIVSMPRLGTPEDLEEQPTAGGSHLFGRPEIFGPDPGVTGWGRTGRLVRIGRRQAGLCFGQALSTAAVVHELLLQ